MLIFSVYMQGDLVYVNYATVEDFMELNRTLNIDTNGKICIAKYGKIFRGDKGVYLALCRCNRFVWSLQFLKQKLKKFSLFLFCLVFSLNDLFNFSQN